MILKSGGTSRYDGVYFVSIKTLSLTWSTTALFLGRARTRAQDIIESFGLERIDLATVSYKEAASDLWDTMQRSMHSKSAEGAGSPHRSPHRSLENS